MGGMTIMALATHRPEVLAERAAPSSWSPRRPRTWARARPGRSGSPPPSSPRRPCRWRCIPPAGTGSCAASSAPDPVRAHMDLTRTLFADTAPRVRAGFMVAMSTMNLLEGIATIGVPTTVMVGSRDRLTAPARAAQMVAAIPGARLVTLAGRGHMLPLEDPDAVTSEIELRLRGLRRSPSSVARVRQNRRMGLDKDFTFDVGEQEKHRVAFHWGQLFGQIRITVDDVQVVEKNHALCAALPPYQEIRILGRPERSARRRDREDEKARPRGGTNAALSCARRRHRRRGILNTRRRMTSEGGNRCFAR